MGTDSDASMRTISLHLFEGGRRSYLGNRIFEIRDAATATAAASGDGFNLSLLPGGRRGSPDSSFRATG